MAADLDPRLLAQLVAVAEHRDFQHAAAALALSPRALTRGLRELEREAGEPLLVPLPATRAPELTAAGARAVDGGRRVLRALARFGEAAAGQDATLRVAHVANSMVLDRVLAGQARVRVRVRVRESSVPDGEQLHALAEHRIDVALCTDPAPLPDGVAAAPLRDDPLVLLGDPVRGVAFTAYGEHWAEHDAVVAALALDRGWDAVAIDAATGSGRELRALARVAGERALLLPQSTLPPAGAGAAAAGAVLRWRVAWRTTDDRAAVRALVAAAQAVAGGAPDSTLSSQPST
jgi:DNA-binding transcriptional LysR family regulator